MRRMKPAWAIGAITLVATSTICLGEPVALAAEQLERIDNQTCRPWHDRVIARHRVLDPEELSVNERLEGRVHVAVVCEPHDTVGAFSLRDTANCEGTRLDWTCEGPWLGLYRPRDGGMYEAVLADTSAKTGTEIIEHLIDKARSGDGWAKDALDGYLYIRPFGDDDTWFVSYEWTDPEHGTFTSVIEVRGRCGKHTCRYRSKFRETYSMLR
jgi:hypothetical protein